MISSLLSTLFSKVYLAQIIAQSSDSDGGGFIFLFLCCFWVIWFALAIVMIVAMYKIFEKASQPGWTAIVPYLNSVIVAHIAGRPWWWGIVPILNIVPIFELAKKFGKSDGFGVGLVLLPFVFFPILGFGKAQLVEPPQKPLF